MYGTRWGYFRVSTTVHGCKLSLSMRYLGDRFRWLVHIPSRQEPAAQLSYSFQQIVTPATGVPHTLDKYLAAFTS